MKKLLPLSLAGSAACIPVFLDMATARNVSQVSDSEMKGTYDDENLESFQTNFNSIAAKSNGVPVGTVISWPIASMPEDAENWLECDGKPVPSNYELAKIMTHTPDYRGMFLRGVGGKAGALGTLQKESVYVPKSSAGVFTMNNVRLGFVEHCELVQDGCAYGDSWGCYGYYYKQVCHQYNATADYYRTGNIMYRSSGSNIEIPVEIKTGDTEETRPENKSVRYLIRAQ